MEKENTLELHEGVAGNGKKLFIVVTVEYVESLKGGFFKRWIWREDFKVLNEALAWIKTSGLKFDKEATCIGLNVTI